MKLSWSRVLRGARAVTALTIVAVLAACGGGDKVGTFNPRRVIAFGDESSAITANGKKYTINVADGDATNCSSNVNWVVYFANSFGKPFPNCSDNGVTSSSENLAVAGAKVADVANQIDTYTANVGGFGSRDLVTVLAGANDILEQYALYPTVGEAALTDEVKRRGAQLAGLVNDIATAGGKVIVVTVPDQGLTPFALKQKALFEVEGDRSAVLKRLTSAFNTEMKVNLLNDGSRIGLVAGDEQVRLMVRFPRSYGFSNTEDAACDPDKRDGVDNGVLPNCSVNTLVDDATVTTYLWADDYQLSPAGHRRIGSAAVSRARNNPF